MLILLGQSWATDESSPSEISPDAWTDPIFEDRAMELLSLLKSKSTDELGEAMRLGPRESQTEFEYYQSGFDKAPHVPAIHLFSGDGMKANKAYRGLRADELDMEDIEWAQDHLCIMSGMYGLLRPLDTAKRHKLTMDMKVSGPAGESLPQFWGQAIAQEMNEMLEAHDPDSQFIVNCLEERDTEALDMEALRFPVVDMDFPGSLGQQQLYKGELARFAIENQCETYDDLSGFFREGTFEFDPDLSDESTLVFVPPHQHAGGRSRRRAAPRKLSEDAMLTEETEHPDEGEEYATHPRFRGTDPRLHAAGKKGAARSSQSRGAVTPERREQLRAAGRKGAATRKRQAAERREAERHKRMRGGEEFGEEGAYEDEEEGEPGDEEELGEEAYEEPQRGRTTHEKLHLAGKKGAARSSQSQGRIPAERMEVFRQAGRKGGHRVQELAHAGRAGAGGQAADTYERLRQAGKKGAARSSQSQGRIPPERMEVFRQAGRKGGHRVQELAHAVRAGAGGQAADTYERLRLAGKRGAELSSQSQGRIPPERMEVFRQAGRKGGLTTQRRAHLGRDAAEGEDVGDVPQEELERAQETYRRVQQGQRKGGLARGGRGSSGARALTGARTRRDEDTRLVDEELRIEQEDYEYEPEEEDEDEEEEDMEGLEEGMHTRSGAHFGGREVAAH